MPLGPSRATCREVHTGRKGTEATGVLRRFVEDIVVDLAPGALSDCADFVSLIGRDFASREGRSFEDEALVFGRNETNSSPFESRSRPGSGSTVLVERRRLWTAVEMAWS